MKSSEEGIESSNPILTDISVDETLKPAASFELDNGTDGRHHTICNIRCYN